MAEKILIKEIKGHIKGYGMIEDLLNDTYFGISKEELSNYSDVFTEFEEDPSLPKHEVGSADPDLYNIPWQQIPRGTLRIYGHKSN